MAKKLQRSTEDRWIGGVCGGIAEYTGIDANLVRLIMVIGAFFAAATLLVYLAGWVLMPEAPRGRTTIVHEPPPPSA